MRQLTLNIKDCVQPQFYKLALWALDCIINKHGDWGDITEVVLPGGRASGKSSFTTMIKILDMIYNRRSNLTLMRNEVNLRAAAFTQVDKDADRLGLSDLLYRVYRPLEFKLIDDKDVKMMFKGAADPSALKSIASKKPIGICHIEEADRIKSYEDFIEIMASVRGSDYLTIITYNPPRSVNHWISALEQPTKNRVVVFTTYLGMPKQWLGASYLQRINELKDSDNKKWRNIYRRTYLGHRVKTGSEVFTNYYDARLDIHNIDEGEQIVQGLDFGFSNDPTRYIIGSYNKELKRLRIYKEISCLKEHMESVGVKIKNLLRDLPYQSDIIYADSAGSYFIDELINMGLYNVQAASKFNGSRDYGWYFLEVLNRIEIDRLECPMTWDEFERAEYDIDDNGEFIGGYPQKNDHSIDAIRYALQDYIIQAYALGYQ